MYTSASQWEMKNHNKFVNILQKKKAYIKFGLFTENPFLIEVLQAENKHKL